MAWSAVRLPVPERRWARCARAGFVLASLAAAACAGRLGPVPITPRDACCSDPDATTLQYLGAGGWRIQHRGSVLLTGPFFSNPGFLRSGLWTIHPDPTRVSRHLPDVTRAEAILVGHAHYDHLMDVAWIARERATRAVVYGSETAGHLLAAEGLPRSRHVRLNGRAGDASRPGDWVTLPSGRIRFMALRAEHAPHALGIELYEGRYRGPLARRPYWAGNWVKGQTFAYLIDLLEPDGSVALRIHYADAASGPPHAFPPQAVLDDREVDLAILCPPGFDGVDRYPDGIVERVRPRWALLGHWENFFRPLSEPLEVVPTLDLPEFVGRLEDALAPGARWSLPEPGKTYAWPPAAGSGEWTVVTP